ncbi:MAG: carbohydrate kinase family protein [Patescibacteria group bacterium]
MTKMKYDIVTIGDVSEDVFIRPAELKISESKSVTTGRVMSFELGEKIPIEEVDYDIGGSAANVAVGLSRIGLKTALTSVIGTDSPGEKIRRRLEAEGVNMEHLNIKELNKTNFAVILNTKDGERTIFVYRGINYQNLKVKKGTKTKWYFVAPLGQDSDLIFRELSECARERDLQVAWNPGSYQIKAGASKYRSFLKNVTVLFVNREEGIKFTDYPIRPKDEDVMKRLRSFGPKIVVMTNGKEGAKVYDGKIFYHGSIIKDVKRVDATGAGDSFATGFLAKLMLDGKDQLYSKELICNALKYGIVNSTSVIAHIGAQRGLLNLAGIEAAITAHPRLQAEVY